MLRAAPDLGRRGAALPGPARGARASMEDAPQRPTVDADRGAGARARSQAMEDAGWDPRRGDRPWRVGLPDADVERRARLRRHRGRAPAGAAHRRARAACCTPWTAASCPAGPSRLAAARADQRAADRPQLLLRRPQGGARRGWPGRPARRWPSRCVARYLADTGELPAQSVGLSVWGTSAMRTSGDDIAEVLALLGVRPVWDEARRRVTGLEVDPARGAGPPAHRRHRAHLRLLPRRVPARAWPCSTTRCSSVAALDEPAEQNYVRATRSRPAEHGDGAAPPPASSGPSRAPTAPGSCS